MDQIKSRIRGLRTVKASELRKNPRNWREHPPEQRAAMAGMLREIGYADALLAYETPDGLTLIDGHLRAEMTPDADVPVLVLDVTESEANTLLMFFDPLAAMAITNEAKRAELESLIEVAERDLVQALSSGVSEKGTTEITRIQLPAEPPQMTWVLVGIPTAEYGTISETIQSIGDIESTIVEIVSNGDAVEKN